MCFCRILVFMAALLATACAVCANIFPVLQRSSDAGNAEQTLWYRNYDANGTVGTKEFVNDSPCKQYKLFFRVSEGLSVGAAAIGLIVIVLTLLSMCVRALSCCLSCIISLLLSVAFAACGVCVALLVYGYLKGYCQNEKVLSDAYPPFKEAGYTFGTSFYLICVACGFFLVTSLFQCCA